MALARPSRQARRLLLAGAAVVSIVGIVLASGAGATPDRPHATPDQPTVGTVTARLDQLAHHAEVLTERYNAAQIQVQHQMLAADRARVEAIQATRRFAEARVPLIRLAVAQYQSNSPATVVGALLSSHDQEAYLDALAAEDMMATRFAALAGQLNAARAAAQSANKRAQRLLGDAMAARNSLGEQRAAVLSQVTRYRSLLATLTAPQREAYWNRGAPSAAQVRVALKLRAPSPAAQKAVDFALAQVGKPYVFAAAGPDAFDCSGLTMAAWEKAGVSLPHLSSAQYQYGTRVSYDELKPGDLVFLYSDIHHVEMYIGNGLAVSAPQEGEDVKIVQVGRDDFYGATRLN